MWSHAAVPNSISSRSRVWTQGAGGRPGTCSWARPPRLVPNLFSYLNSPEALCGGLLCPLCPVALPCLTSNHTTQGKEYLGVEGQVTAPRGPALPLPPGPFSPCSLFKVRLWSHPAGTGQPHSRLRARVSDSEPLQASEPMERPLLNLQNFS